MVADFPPGSGPYLRVIRERAGISRARLAGVLFCDLERVWQIEREASVDAALADRVLTCIRALRPDIIVTALLVPADARAIEDILRTRIPAPDDVR